MKKDDLKLSTTRLRDRTVLDICSENGLARPIFTNVIDQSLSLNKIRAVMQILSKALISTLGPDGSTTILQGTAKDHLVTKDGLDVISRITFTDEVSRTILDLVKTISHNQVLAVGDGSTSAIVVANALYQELTSPENKEILKDVPAKVITDMLNIIAKYLEETLKKTATPVSKDMHELANIAAIAMNNDTAGGKLMCDIYKKIGRNGFITTDTADKYEDDMIEYKKGISWKSGFLDQSYAETYDGRTVIHEKPFVFLTDSDITYEDCETIFNPLLGMICGQRQQELVIVAHYVNDEAKAFFRTNRMIYKLGHPELKFTVVDIEQLTEHGVNNLKDLALLSGAKIYQKGINTPSELVMSLDPATSSRPGVPKFLGTALKATITKDETEVICDDSLLSPAELARKDAEIAKIKEKIAKLDAKSVMKPKDIENKIMNEFRLANLENITVIYHVGGATAMERETRQRLIEDAIFASKSALRYGYIIGGNIMIPKIIDMHKDDVIKILKDKFDYLGYTDDFYNFFVDVIKESFLASYMAVLDNSYLSDDKIRDIIVKCVNEDVFYNLKTHKFEKVTETSVINSVDTDIQIMKSCLSLIGLLSTSNQFITINCNIEDQIIKK